MKNKLGKSKKVIVALSGGVDSAVAAALLKKQGYDLVAVYFRFTDALNSEIQAGRIAKKLNISLKIVDARREFKKQVIDYFVDSYEKGRTPNPCVVCNKEMKFRLLFDLAKKEKADCVATGHYVRIKREFPISNFQFPIKSKNSKSELRIKNYKLLQAKDRLKDQSYFLYKLNQEDLARIIFPLGKYKKSEVKIMAEKMGLPLSENESQDVCFIQNNDASGFLKNNIKSKAGKIVDIEGNVLGKHKGLSLYTIGQRKGIEIGGKSPFFVLRKNARKNELVVTNDLKDLLTKEFRVGKTNWIDLKTKFPLRAGVQIRYHAQIFPAIIKREAGGKYAVAAKKPLRAVTGGQSAVFYKNGEVLGGGIII
jgi:tRNA-uridine 2-sulfurtransferase